ncbi:hypothetical protein [Brevundimonas aurifodinae]|uniref:Transporter n=2 Tax=Brevundimonas TaxID=41275 RepID=A0ABV1NLX3_9CAUL|nr:MAG: hypothetical protein B7Z42_00445 [Brevundimonas sp. 12-68-7]OYX35621.1 MAG: hypothetical protein B7Z01_01600 [Brevundimonas subvibrioides]
MTDTKDEITDIAWLRGLAEEGTRTPIRGASILFAAGMIYGFASLAHGAVEAGLVEVGTEAFGWIWGVAVLAFLAALVVLIGRLKSQGGVETAANRAFGIVWAALGWGIFSLFTSLILSDLSRQGASSMADWALVIPSIIMAFYGVGWAVTATMVRSRPLWVLALASFAAAPALAVLSGSPAQYLAYAAALFGLVAVPGFFLMRAAKG